MTGKLALPVRRDQAKRVPALRPPTAADLRPFEHHVLNPSLLQAIADRQPGLAAAHHGHWIMRPQPARIARWSLRQGEHLDPSLLRRRRQRACGLFEPRELIERRAASKTVARAHPLRRDVQGAAHPIEEVAERVVFAGREVLFDHIRR
jgi:hypothetical protein